jgi:CheY-like chemotaxis protein
VSKIEQQRRDGCNRLELNVVFSRAKEASLSKLSVISVVDDDASVRAAMNNLLRSRGCVVHTFGSAEEFLGSPQLNDTSCVIADVQMSAMNGIELLVNMRMRGYAAPYIVVTAFPDESVRTRSASRRELLPYKTVFSAEPHRMR